MKKKLPLLAIHIVLLLLSNWGLSQPKGLHNMFEYRPDTTHELCKKELVLAKRAFRNNNYTIQFAKPIPYSNTSQKILKDSFNVQIEYPELFFESCYNYFLKQEVIMKFNKDIFLIAQNLADSIDESGKGSSMFQFIAGESIDGYIRSQLKNSERKQLKKKYSAGKIFVSLKINSDGTCTLLKKNMWNGTQKIEPSIKRVLEEKVLFRPEIKEGIPISTEIGLNITL